METREDDALGDTGFEGADEGGGRRDIAVTDASAAEDSVRERSTLLTLFSSRSRPLTKTLSLEDGGGIKRLVQNPVPDLATTMGISTLAELEALFTKATAFQAFAYGVSVCSSDPIRVMTTKAFERCRAAAKPMSAVTRTAEHFRYGSGPGVLFLDYDPADDGQALLPDQLIEALRAAVPALRLAALLWRPSSGSYVYNADTGAEVRGLRGQHVYAIVDRADAIPHIGTIITQRLWLAGHGRVQVSGAGKMLLRTLIDAAVWQGHHLDFVRAHCGAGLEQRLPPGKVFPGDADDVLDSEGRLLADMVAPLSPGEADEVARRQAEARFEASTRAEASKTLWIEALALRDAGPDALPEVLERARSAARKVAEGEELPRGFEIVLQGGKRVTVGDILDDRPPFHHRRCADPMEPEYRDDDRIGLIITDGGSPSIYSHAHGGVTYVLGTAEERAAQTAVAFDAVPGELRARPDGWRFVTSAEFVQASRPLKWFIKGVLPHAELGVIYGESGSGKTFFTLDMVAHVAQGTPWRGYKVNQARVGYVIAEGAQGFRNRLNALTQHLSCTLAEIPLLVLDGAPNLGESTETDRLAESVDVAGGVDLIVVDTLAATSPGANENSSEDMGAIIGHCRQLSRVTKAMVLLVHHSGKDPRRGARGWSGLRAACDFEMEVVDDGATRQASVTKAKDGEEGAPFHFTLAVVNVGQDEDGDIVTSCGVRHEEGGALMGKRAGKKQRAPGIHEGRLLQMLRNGPCAKTALIANAVEAAGPPPRAPARDRRHEPVQRALASLVKSRRVTLDADGTARLAGSGEV